LSSMYSFSFAKWTSIKKKDEVLSTSQDPLKLKRGERMN